MSLKRFLYTASVESVAGWQTFYIDAETREEADERARDHDTNGIYQEELSVEDIGRLVFDNETETDDFGDYPPTDAPPTPLADAAAIAEREADAAWEAYLNEQKQILGMPGLHARPCFLAGYRAALATTEATDAIAPTEGARAPCVHCHSNYPLHDLDCPVAVAILAAPSPQAPAVDALTTGASFEFDDMGRTMTVYGDNESIKALLRWRKRREDITNAALSRVASEPMTLTDGQRKAIEWAEKYADTIGFNTQRNHFRALLANRGSEQS